MDCLILPVSILTKRSPFSYRRLPEKGTDFHPPVTVVVGRERKEFVVDPFILEEVPFRILMETAKKKTATAIIVEDVEAMLFEHMLWLMYNDSSSLSHLNLPDLIDFYAHDY